MRVFSLLISLALLAPPARAQPVVAVFDIDGRTSKLPAETLTSLADCLATALAGDGTYRVVLRDQVQATLAPAKEGEAPKPCFDYRCQVEVARKLSANRVVATTVHKLGGDCIVTSTLAGLEQPVSERVAKVQAACAPADLVTAMDTVAEQLRRGPATAAAPPSAPTPADDPPRIKSKKRRRR